MESEEEMTRLYLEREERMHEARRKFLELAEAAEKERDRNIKKFNILTGWAFSIWLSTVIAAMLWMVLTN